MNRREQLDAALEAVTRPLREATGERSWAVLEDGAGSELARWPRAGAAEKSSARGRFPLAGSALADGDMHLVLGGALDIAALELWGPAAAHLCSQILERELELEDLAAALGRCFEERVFLHDLASELGAASSEHELCARLAERSAGLVRAERAFLALHQPGIDAYEITASFGFRSIERGPFPIDCGLTGAVLREGGPCLIADVLAFPPEGLAPFEECASRGLLLVPLQINGSAQPLGVLGVLDGAARGGFGGDEERLLGFLADHVAAILGALRRRERESEARGVRQAIESLLPKPWCELRGFDVAARLDAAPHGGSACYDGFALRDGSLALALLEVSARGVAAPMHLAAARAALRSALAAGAGPQEAIAALNAQLDGDLARAGCLLSAAVAVLSRDGALRCAGAGHPPALLRRGADARVELLELTGWIAGLRPEATGEELRAQLEPGDALVLPSIGIVTAAERPSGPELGIDRLRETLTCSGASTADAVIRDVLAAVERFSGTDSRDDRALLVVRLESSTAPRSRAHAAARKEVTA